jgi:hypothetical protein
MTVYSSVTGATENERLRLVIGITVSVQIKELEPRQDWDPFLCYNYNSLIFFAVTAKMVLYARLW